MKKHFARIALFSVVVAGLVAVPAASRADDSPTKTDKPAATTPAPKKKARTSFHGSVTAVDTAAMSLTVGTNLFYVTSETKIIKADKPATLSEITVGETAKGTYKVDEAGKQNAVTITAGDKAPKKPKKKAAEAAVPASAPPAPTK
ncbi:MAG: hypothetical protein P4N60_19840 [Verrucomicrobiae bacterium]|nr:hypothetical protein [Verrucomicrobiae bacterium]